MQATSTSYTTFKCTKRLTISPYDNYAKYINGTRITSTLDHLWLDTVRTSDVTLRPNLLYWTVVTLSAGSGSGKQQGLHDSDSDALTRPTRQLSAAHILDRLITDNNAAPADELSLRNDGGC